MSFRIFANDSDMMFTTLPYVGIRSRSGTEKNEMSEHASKPKQSPPRISLSWKLYIMILLMTVILSVGILFIGTQAYMKKVNMIYQNYASTYAQNIAQEIDMEEASYYARCLAGEEFQKVRKEAIDSQHFEIMENWLKSQPRLKPGSILYSVGQTHRNTLFDDFEDLFDFTDLFLEKDGLSRIEICYHFDNLYVTIMDQIYDLGEIETNHEEIHKNGLDDDEVHGWELCGLSTIPKTNGDNSEYIQVSCFLGMNNLIRERNWFIINTLIMILIFIAVVTLLAMYLSHHYVIDPLQKLTIGTTGFTGGEGAYTRANVLDMRIRYNDEISDLCREIRDMQNKIVDYMDVIEKEASEKERIDTEMRLAAEIQKAMLPDLTEAFTGHPDFEIYADMHPAKVVGGDFYDFFFLDETHLALVIADVSGKGIPASLFMMASEILIRNEALSGDSPAKIFEGVNKQISSFNRVDMFVTAWLGIIDLETGVMRCSNAGHEFPVIRRNNGSFMLFNDPHSLVIGGVPDVKFREYEIQFREGDMLFVYTDGVAEAENTETRFFSVNGTVKALNMNPKDTPKEVIDYLYEELARFAGDAEQSDDITMLCFRYKRTPNE